MPGDGVTSEVGFNSKGRGADLAGFETRFCDHDCSLCIEMEPILPCEGVPCTGADWQTLLNLDCRGTKTVKPHSAKTFGCLEEA